MMQTLLSRMSLVQVACSWMGTTCKNRTQTAHYAATAPDKYDLPDLFPTFQAQPGHLKYLEYLNSMVSRM